MNKALKRILASVSALALCFAFTGCKNTDTPPNDDNPPAESNWRDNMHRTENDFLQDDNRRPSREPFVDDTPEEAEGAELTTYRFEAENAKIRGNTNGANHFCTGKSLEFSPSFSGNLALCNLGSATVSFSVNSDKKVRSNISFRISSQSSTVKEVSLAEFASASVNSKPVIDLSPLSDPDSASVAEGSSSMYFNMVTVNTKISLAEGRNVIDITSMGNMLNIDYIEISTSATLEDNTDSTLTSPENFVNVTVKPTETAKGKIAFDCNKDGCTNQKQRERNLPALTDDIYTKEVADNGEIYSIDMLKGKAVIVSKLAYTLKLGGGATFGDGTTEKPVFVGTKPELKVNVPDGKALAGWKDAEDNEYPVAFVMPDHNLSIEPIFVDANVTLTIQGGKINGSSSVKAAIGTEIDLSGAVVDSVPSGKVLKGWSVLTDRTKVYTETYAVTGSVTLIPVFESTTILNNNTKVGKINVTGNLYGSRVKGCYSVIDNKTVGAIDDGNGYFEYGSIYHFKGGTQEAPAEQIATESWFLSQEMNSMGISKGDVEKRTVTTTVENFATEDVTLRFALITSSGDPNSKYKGESEKTVTIPAGQTVTFTFDIEYIHDSIMLNMMVKEKAVSEVFIGVYQYITLAESAS